MRKTIYVKSQDQWDEVKSKSKSMGLSISEYLLGVKNIPVKDVSSEVLENLKYIREKMDELCAISPRMMQGKDARKNQAGVAPMVEQGFCKPTVDGSSPSTGPKKVIKTVEDIPSTFRSYSKERQLGKKK